MQIDTQTFEYDNSDAPAPELHAMVEQRVQECLAIIRDKIDPETPQPRITYFKDNPRVAGASTIADARPVVAINRDFLEHNPSKMIENTVTHEMGHVAVYALFFAGSATLWDVTVDDHGKVWQDVMRDLFQSEPRPFLLDADIAAYSVA